MQYSEWQPSVSHSGLHYWQFSVKWLIYTKTKDNMYAFISENIIFVLHFIMNSDELSADWIGMCAKDCGWLKDMKDRLDASFKMSWMRDAKWRRPSKDPWNWDGLQRHLMMWQPYVIYAALLGHSLCLRSTCKLCTISQKSIFALWLKHLWSLCFSLFIMF